MINKYKVRIGSGGKIRRSLNGKTHCTTGPAVEYLNGYRVWYQRGVWQREDSEE